MLSRVEGMSADALARRRELRRRFAGDFLRRLEGRVGVNVGANVGHCAVRRYVMGDDASERTATDDEIAAMQELVRRRMRDGAIGFTSSQLDLHVAHDGRGVPSNHAAPRSSIALVACSASSAAARSSSSRGRFLTGYSDDDRDLILAMAARLRPAGEPQHAHDDAARPRRMERSLEFARSGERRTRGPPDVREQPARARISRSADLPLRRDAELPRHAHAAPAERDAALRDPAVREQMRKELADPTGRSFVFVWQVFLVETVASRTRALGRPERHRDRGGRSGAGPARRIPRPLTRRGPRDAVRARGAARRETAGRDRDDDPQPRSSWPAAPTAARTCCRSAAPTSRPGCSPSGSPTSSRSRRPSPG